MTDMEIMTLSALGVFAIVMAGLVYVMTRGGKDD